MAETAVTAAVAALASRMGKRGRKVGIAAGSFGPHLGWLIQHNPHKSFSEISALPEVDKAMKVAVESATRDLMTTLDVAALSGRKLGIAAHRKDLVALGLKVPPVQPPTQGAYLTAAKHRATERMAAALPELRTALLAGWASIPDGVSSNEVAVAKARGLKLRLVVARWSKEIGSRSEKAAAGVVRKAHAEVAREWAADMDRAHPDVTVTKTWHATNPEPCPLCAELDGMTVGAQQTFPGDHDVWWDGQSPLRHVGCGCYLSYDLDGVGTDGDEVASDALIG